MGFAHWYDPTLGTFTSLDPVLATSDTQQQAGYNDAAANPITNSDPSGLSPDAGTIDHSATPCYLDPIPCRSFWTSKNQKNAMAGLHGTALKQTRDLQRYYLEQHLLEIQRKIARLKAEIQKAIEKAYGPAVNPFNPLTLLNRAGFLAEKALMAPIVKLLHKLKPIINAIDDITFFASMLTGLGELQGGVAAIGADAADLGGADALGGAIGELEAAADSKSLQSGLDALTDAESDLSTYAKDLCVTNSFTATTRVLMADGTSKPIKSVKVGDKIKNALPGADSGAKGQAHAVTAIHITHTDRDYVDVTTATSTGRETISGTAHHLYWDATTQAWTPANHLQIGDHLQTIRGHTTAITGLRSYSATMVTYNLTIAGLHTYYVQTGAIPLLVHNSGCATVAKGVAEEARAAQELEDKGYNIVGQQISVRTTAANVRIDIVATRDGQTYFFDVKNGRYAGFTKNQGRLGGYEAISIRGGQYCGQNAADAGLFGSFGPRDVYVIQYP